MKGPSILILTFPGLFLNQQFSVLRHIHTSRAVLRTMFYHRNRRSYVEKEP